MTPDQPKAEKPARERSPRKRQTLDDKRQTLDELLDEALEATFPASDPIAILEPAPAGVDHEHR
jgi:hypothetical protein